MSSSINLPKIIISTHNYGKIYEIENTCYLILKYSTNRFIFWIIIIWLICYSFCVTIVRLNWLLPIRNIQYQLIKPNLLIRILCQVLLFFSNQKLLRNYFKKHDRISFNFFIVRLYFLILLNPCNIWSSLIISILNLATFNSSLRWKTFN